MSWGVPKMDGFLLGKIPSRKWMRTRSTPISRNHHMISSWEKTWETQLIDPGSEGQNGLPIGVATTKHVALAPKTSVLLWPCPKCGEPRAPDPFHSIFQWGTLHTKKSRQYCNVDRSSPSKWLRIHPFTHSPPKPNSKLSSPPLQDEPSDSGADLSLPHLSQPFQAIHRSLYICCSKGSFPASMYFWRAKPLPGQVP